MAHDSMSAYNPECIGLDGFVTSFIADGKGNQNIIFISIGCASNLLQKSLMKLDEKDNQQYTPYLKKIKNFYPEIPLYLVLIDPELYNPPYCVKSSRQHFLLGKFTNPLNVELPEGWCRNEQYSNVYINNIENIHVYVIREMVVYTEVDTERESAIEKNHINIIDQLAILNEHCKGTNDILFVHDFTGRNTHYLSYFFDKELCGYKDRIIYDITLRSDGMCFVDLLNPLYDLRVVDKGDGIITFKNPYNIDISELVQEYTNSSDDIYKKQIIHTIRVIIRNFFEIIYVMFRQMYMLVKEIHANRVDVYGVINRLNMIISNSYPNLINLYYGYDVKTVINDIYDAMIKTHKIDIKRLESLVNALDGIVRKELDKLLLMINKRDKKSSDMLIVQMYKDLYKWEEIVREFIFCTLIEYDIYSDSTNLSSFL